jgi:hypothetical protein
MKREIKPLYIDDEEIGQTLIIEDNVDTMRPIFIGISTTNSDCIECVSLRIEDIDDVIAKLLEIAKEYADGNDEL